MRKKKKKKKKNQDLQIEFYRPQAQGAGRDTRIFIIQRAHRQVRSHSGRRLGLAPGARVSITCGNEIIWRRTVHVLYKGAGPYPAICKAMFK